MRTIRMPPGFCSRQNTTCLPCSMRRKPGRTPSHDRPNLRIVGQHLATSLKLPDVTVGLSFAPGAEGVTANAQQVSLGASRKTKACHGLAPRHGELALLPDTRKCVALCNPTDVTFVDGRP